MTSLLELVIIITAGIGASTVLFCIGYLLSFRKEKKVTCPEASNGCPVIMCHHFTLHKKSQDCSNPCNHKTKGGVCTEVVD